MSVNDTLFVRVRGADAAAVTRLATDLGAFDFQAEGEWLRASVPSKTKLVVLKGLMNSQYAISDVLVERNEIESEYVKLLSTGAPGSDR